MLSGKQKLCLLTSAMEGGSNYWYLLGDLPMIPKKGYVPQSEEMKEELKRYDQQMIDCLVNRIWEALMLGAEIPVYDLENPDEQLGILSKASMEKAEKLMLEKHTDHFADAIADRDDAVTGDVFFQLAVMGEIVYG